MRGFPKHIATQQDIENLKRLYPKELDEYQEKCLEASYVFEATKETAMDEKPKLQKRFDENSRFAKLWPDLAKDISKDVVLDEK